MQPAVARIPAATAANELILPTVEGLATLDADEIGRRSLATRFLSGDILAVGLPPKTPDLGGALAAVGVKTAFQVRIAAKSVSRLHDLAAGARLEVDDECHPRRLPASCFSRGKLVGCARSAEGFT